MTITAPDDRRGLLQSALHAIDDLQARLDEAEAAGRQPIAVVGLSCRFPGGATNPERYWELLRDGRDVVTEYPSERRALVEAAGADFDAFDDGRAWYGGFLDDIDRFDPQFFGISPREAAAMDPQQRLVLEVGWEALERAGIAPDSLDGTATGVFLGITATDWAQLAKLAGADCVDVYSATGGALNAAAGRLAFTLGLQGPCMAIDTACSSSLVALHQACQSLRTGESNLALAGGVNLLLLPEGFVLFNRWGMMAPDGRCKTFDAAADGFVRAEGCGILVLKRLRDAVADGDQVLAVIRGSAVNQDGRSSGLTVPNGLAEQAVVRQALAAADVAPADVQYFEAHGTGTALGDPIEIEALGAVLGQDRAADQTLVVGSVKTNLGHLESAAGIAGVIKVVLAMQHGEIPPHLHYYEPSPKILWPAFPMVVPTERMPWPAIDGRRLAGVNGFGFSGTNAHVVIESPPVEATDARVVVDDIQVVTLSARTDDALREAAAELASWIDTHPDVALADVSATTNRGRAHLPCRLAVTAATPGQLAERLRAASIGETPAGVVTGRHHRPRLAFLYTGQGAQHPGMARDLYESEPVFRAALDRCAALTDPLLDRPLLSVVFAAPGSPDAALLDQTAYTQPALLAVEHALSELWRSWGVVPDAVLGHSVGEIVAACMAGVFSLEDAVRLVVARGALMQALPAGGAMAAISAPHDDVVEVLAGRPGIAVAAVNGPRHTVISGEDGAVAEVTSAFTARSVRVQALTVSHAFHSPLMEPMLDDFRRVASSITYRPAQGRLISNVTGTMAGPEVATADYWVRHVMAPVRFADGVAALRDAGVDTFVEVGPHAVLTALAQACLPDDDVTWVASLRRNRPDGEQLLGAAGALFTVGAKVDWRAVRPDGRRRTLPTYPFQRQHYWLEPVSPSGRRRTGGHPLTGPAMSVPLLDAAIREATVAASSPAWLADHRLAGTIVFPATAYAELVLAAIRPATDEIESMAVLEALVIPEEGEIALQVVETPTDGARELRVASVGSGPPSADAVSVHARAMVRARRDGTPTPPPVDLSDDAIAAAYPVEIDVDAYYEQLWDIGLTYGPTFRGLTRLVRRDGAALGRVELPGDATEGARDQLHPALFDACFHVLGAALAMSDPATADRIYVPVAVEGLRLDRPGASAAWCQVTVLGSVDAAAPPSSVTATLQLFDDDGQPIATVDRLEVRRTSRAMWQRLASRREPVYELAWRAVSATGEVAPARQWFVVGDATVRVAAEHLAAELVARGVITSVASGAGPTDVAANLAAAIAGTTGPLGVVYVGGLGDDGASHAAVSPGLGGALTVTQALADHPATDVRLWLVTRGAQSIDGESPSVAGASLWGFARVVASEHRQLACTCIDIDPAAEAGLGGLADELLLGDAEEQIAHRGRQRFVARLARLDLDATAPPRAPYQLALAGRGSLDALSYEPLERMAPGPGEVEIEVRATGINFRDVLNVLGMYPGNPGPPGLECAGVVTAVGDGVTDLAAGDAVVGIAPRAFNSHVVTRADLVVRKPAGLTFADAAAVPIAYLTAAYGLGPLASLQPGESVLIHAGAGGVGMAAVLMAQRLGAEVFATVGSPAKQRALEALGVGHIASSRTLDFAKQVLVDTDGRGVDVVLNSLSDDFIDASFDVLTPTGRFLEIGKRGIWTAEQAAGVRPQAAYLPYDLADLVDEPGGLGPLLEQVVQDVASGRLGLLPVRAFASGDIERAFRYVAQARHIGKVVITHPPLRGIDADGAYLVTGGLGGIGLNLAAGLVARGARDITLAARSAPTAEAKAAIAELEAAGATVEVAQVDVTDGAAVERVVADAGRRRPLRGVFHLAGTTDDGALAGQTGARFEGVLAPKVVGAARLDDATRHLDLDHFVLFSSASALLGNPGQSAYAAANRGLDALAARRRATGRPGLSIDWGAWSGTGMAARLDDRQRDRLAGRGGGMLEPEAALTVLDRLLLHDRANVAVLEMDWARALEQFDQPPPLLAELGSSAQSDRRPAADLPKPNSLVDALAAAPAEARRDLTVAHVEEQLGRVLGLSSGIDRDQDLTELGMDSLTAVELTNRLRSSTGLALESTLVFEQATVNALAGSLVEQLDRLVAVKARIDAMSPDEVARALAARRSVA